jgi:hypothetical protein
MSGKLMSVLVALGILSSVAIALTVTPSDFVTPVVHWAYPTKADFDWIFAEVETVSRADHEHTAADSEKIRLAVLKRMNLGQFSK